jgi:hypothetical protein
VTLNGSKDLDLDIEHSKRLIPCVTECDSFLIKNSVPAI